MKDDSLKTKALLFIPDISGFTKFVNDTEVEHSGHIIRELLEIIINSNDLELQVNEIEGDAVLFFRVGTPPDAARIAGQVRKMFMAFHKYLREIEALRICQCGACTTAINLTLKFILHFGDISVSNIGGYQKLLGRDIIIAHRLMKNSAPDSEYLLITHNMISMLEKASLEKAFNWAPINHGYTEYKHIGKIHYGYVLLTPLRSEVQADTLNTRVEKFPDPIVAEIFVAAPVRLIYETIVDLGKRPLWTEGLKTIDFNRNDILRIGSRHICRLPSGLVELETIHHRQKEGIIEYAERAVGSRLLPGASTLFQLKDHADGTTVRTEFHYKKRPVLGVIIDPIIRSRIEASLKKSSENLKNLCEEAVRKSS